MRRRIGYGIILVLIGFTFYFPGVAYLDAQKTEIVQGKGYVRLRWHLGGRRYAEYESKDEGIKRISKVENPWFPFLPSAIRAVTVYPPVDDKYYTLRVWDSNHGPAAYILVECEPPSCWYKSFYAKANAVLTETEMRELFIEGMQRTTKINS